MNHNVESAREIGKITTTSNQIFSCSLKKNLMRNVSNHSCVNRPESVHRILGFLVYLTYYMEYALKSSI